MNRATEALVLTFVLGLLLAAAQPVTAYTITDLGIDVDRGGAWRSTSVDKPDAFDPNGDNAYGTDGYYCYGIPSDGGGLQEIQSLPSYIASLTTHGSFHNNNYPKIDDPSKPIAPSVADMTDTGMRYIGSTSYYEFFTFELADSVDFVVTTIIDDHSSLGLYRPRAVKVTGPGGTSAELAGLDAPTIANGTLDYVFFQISGDAGDTFGVSLLSGGTYGVTVTGLGFEALPEPSTATLAATALIGLLVCSWRKRR